LEVCQVRVVDWPGSRVFGFADSEAVGALGAGGGGGGGGATFLWHAPRNINALRAKISAAHLVILMVVIVIPIPCLITLCLIAIPCFIACSPVFRAPAS